MGVFPIYYKRTEIVFAIFSLMNFLRLCLRLPHSLGSLTVEYRKKYSQVA